MKTGKVTRRRVLSVMAGSTVIATIALPYKWMKPVVESVIVPTHAAFSLFTTTTTTTTTSTTTTTTAGPTTTAGTTPAPTTTPGA